MPPIPPDVVRVNVNWDLGLGEIAVNSLHFRLQHNTANTVDWANDMTQRFADLARDGLAAAWGQLGSHFTSNTKLRDCTAYHLNTDGLTIDKRTALPPSGGLAGTAESNALPMEVATVLSLYGYAPGQYDPLGARKRGRIYLPPFAVSKVDGFGFLANPNALLTACQVWFNYMHNRVMSDDDAVQDRARCVILSRRFGEVNDVAQLRVDNLFDVQKRRQNAYPVAAVAGALTGQGP